MTYRKCRCRLRPINHGDIAELIEWKFHRGSLRGPGAADLSVRGIISCRRHGTVQAALPRNVGPMPDNAGIAKL